MDDIDKFVQEMRDIRLAQMEKVRSVLKANYGRPLSCEVIARASGLDRQLAAHLLSCAAMINYYSSERDNVIIADVQNDSYVMQDDPYAT
jgi:hypothetical protein